MTSVCQKEEAKLYVTVDWIPGRFTNVWIKTKEGWQSAARQAAQILTD